jgi:tetratricopeptide (TPR) repeat protein
VDSVQELLKSAQELQASGDEDEAINVYRAILVRESKDVSALHSLGVLMNRREDYDQAAPLLEQAVAIHPSDPALHVELGEAYRSLGAYQDAIGCCLIGLRLRPIYPEGWNTLGLALLGSGDLEGALEKFLKAIACSESFFAGHANAGLVLQELGRTEDAIQHLRRAEELSLGPPAAGTRPSPPRTERQWREDVPLRFEEVACLAPSAGVAEHDAADSLRLLGRTEEARTRYMRAIRLEPGLAISYLHVGITLCFDGHLAEALPWYKLAVEMEPENPVFWEELAELYQKRDESDKAVACWRRVLDLSPTAETRVRIEMGCALQQDGRPEEALEQFLIVRDGSPDSALAHFSLGGVYEVLGRMAEAEAMLREATRLRPRFPAAYARLATLLRGEMPDGDQQIAEDLLQDPQLEAYPRARLLFAIAHVEDARGNYTRAAACLREANELTLQSRRADGVIYRPEEHERFVDRLIAAFDAEFFHQTSGLGLATRRPVFVIGLPRSGTTLVEQIIASHPRAYGAGERMFARRMFEKLPSVVQSGLAPAECLPHLDEYSLKRLAAEHLGKLNGLDLGRFDKIVDKMPENYSYIGLITAMFPGATLIHCRRDPRDVAVSCWMSDFRAIRWANDLGHIGSRLREYYRVMDHWRKVFPAKVLEVDYEDTVSDLEGTARRLIDACGLNWDPVCLEFHKTQRAVQTASLTQVRRPIYKSSVARWRHYRDELADLFSRLEQFICC